MSRTNKFYRKNEEEVMLSLGIDPTINSGSGWIEKEDGQSEHLICQLKSTDAQSIRLNKRDFDILNHNALVSHKIPIFAIQFLNPTNDQMGEVYLLVKPDQLQDVANYIDTGKHTKRETFLGIDLNDSEDIPHKPIKNKISSGASARERFRKEREQKFKKKEKSAT